MDNPKHCQDKRKQEIKTKNRLKVAPPTAKPPHNHITTVSPSTGKAETKLVMTVAPQKDICPQGRT